MEIKELKTRDIADNPDNPRQKLGDISSLMRSIKALGLQQPISVRAVSKTKFVVVAGARRLAAVKKLGLESVTCVIHSADESTQLASIAENTAREDLTVDELADALVRLEGLEVSDKEIANALAIEESSLTAARVVAKASKKSRSKVLALAPETRQLTLEESASLIRFVDQPERLEQLGEAVEYEPDQLPHLIARYEEEDALAQKFAELRASVLGAIEIPPFRASYGERPPKGAEPLHNLTSSDGKALTATSHASCEYRAFMILGTRRFTDEKPALVHYCSDWEAAGHKLSEKPKQVWRQEFQKRELPKADADARRTVIANNKAWTPATKVRRAWIEEFVERKELNQSAKAWVLTELVSDSDRIAGSYVLNDKWSGPMTFEKSFVLVWSLMAQSRESMLDRVSWRPGNYDQEAADSYMSMLKSQGYPVSEVESLLILKAASDVA